MGAMWVVDGAVGVWSGRQSSGFRRSAKEGADGGRAGIAGRGSAPAASQHEPDNCNSGTMLERTYPTGGGWPWSATSTAVSRDTRSAFR